MILSNSDLTLSHLQHEKIRPRFIEANKKLRSVKSSTEGYLILLTGYARSSIRDFESYLIIEAGLDEKDIQLLLKQYNSKFATYKIKPGFY